MKKRDFFNGIDLEVIKTPNDLLWAMIDSGYNFRLYGTKLVYELFVNLLNKNSELYGLTEENIKKLTKEYEIKKNSTNGVFRRAIMVRDENQKKKEIEETKKKYKEIKRRLKDYEK